MELTSEQLAYAASDVLYLHALWAKLEAVLIREDIEAGRLAAPLAQTLQDGSAYILAYPKGAARNLGLASFLAWLRAKAAADSGT